MQEAHAVCLGRGLLYFPCNTLQGWGQCSARVGTFICKRGKLQVLRSLVPGFSKGTHTKLELSLLLRLAEVAEDVPEIIDKFRSLKAWLPKVNLDSLLSRHVHHLVPLLFALSIDHMQSTTSLHLYMQCSALDLIQSGWDCVLNTLCRRLRRTATADGLSPGCQDCTSRSLSYITKEDTSFIWKAWQLTSICTWLTVKSLLSERCIENKDRDYCYCRRPELLLEDPSNAVEAATLSLACYPTLDLTELVDSNPMWLLPNVLCLIEELRRQDLQFAIMLSG